MRSGLPQKQCGDLIARLGDRLFCGKILSSPLANGGEDKSNVANGNNGNGLPTTLVRERKAKKKGSSENQDGDLLSQMCALLCSAGVGESPRKRRPLEPPPPYVRDEVLRGSPTGRRDAEMILGILETKLVDQGVAEALEGLSFSLTHEVVSRVILGTEKLSTVCGFFEWACSQGYRPSILVYNSVFQILVKHGRLQDAYEKFRNFDVKPNRFTYGIMVDALASVGNVEEALRTFEDAKKLGQDFVRTCSHFLIRGLCKSGKVSEAMTQYEQLRCRMRLEVGSYNYLIGGLVERRLLDKALAVRKHMDEDYCKPNEHTYRPLISGLSHAKRVEEACDLLEEMLSKGYTPDAVTYTALIDGLCKSRQFNKACFFVEKMETPDIVTYSTLVDGLCDLGKMDQAFELVEQITERGNRLDTVLYTILIKGLCRQRQTDNALKMFETMLETGCSPTSVTYNTLMQGLIREGRVMEARHLLDEMLSKRIEADAITYRIICEDFAKRHNFESARELIERTKDESEYLDAASYVALIDKLSRRNQMQEALQVFEEMPGDMKPSVAASVPLVRGFVKEGNMVEADKVIQKLFEDRSIPNLQLQQAIVSGLHQLNKDGKLDEAVDEMIRMMEAEEWTPHALSCNLFLEGFCAGGYLDSAFKLVREMTSTLSDHVWDMLISRLCDAGRAAEAGEILKLALGRGLVLEFKSHQDVIQALLDADMVKQAVEQYRLLLEHGKFSEWAVVMAHGRWMPKLCAADVDQARDCLQLLVRRGMVPLARSYNVLLESYFKLGRLEDAATLFHQMRASTAPNSSTYTILVGQYCRAGLLDEAVRAFQEMAELGFQPLYTTYNLLVRELCKGDKVEEGYQVLHQLVRMGREPPLVTYNAVFRAFLEARRLDMARQVFNDMTKAFRLDHVDFHCSKF